MNSQCDDYIYIYIIHNTVTSQCDEFTVWWLYIYTTWWLHSVLTIQHDDFTLWWLYKMVTSQCDDFTAWWLYSVVASQYNGFTVWSQCDDGTTSWLRNSNSILFNKRESKVVRPHTLKHNQLSDFRVWWPYSLMTWRRDAWLRLQNVTTYSSGVSGNTQLSVMNRDHFTGLRLGRQSKPWMVTSSISLIVSAENRGERAPTTSGSGRVPRLAAESFCPLPCPHSAVALAFLQLPVGHKHWVNKPLLREQESQLLKYLSKSSTNTQPMEPLVPQSASLRQPRSLRSVSFLEGQ